MSDDDGTDGNDGTYNNGFPMLIVILAIVGHVCIIAIVMYFSCCKNGCSCKITFENTNATNNARDANTVEHSDATNLVGGNDVPRPSATRHQIPVITWAHTTLLARVRAMMHVRTPDGEQSEPEVEIDVGPQPPPYTEFIPAPSFAGQGHDNEGAEFSDLPTYQDYVRQIPALYVDVETGCLEEEKPPAYDEVVQS